MHNETYAQGTSVDHYADHVTTPPIVEGGRG